MGTWVLTQTAGRDPANFQQSFVSCHKFAARDVRDDLSCYLMCHAVEACAGQFVRVKQDGISDMHGSDAFIIELAGGQDGSTFSGYVSCQNTNERDSRDEYSAYATIVSKTEENLRRAAVSIR